MSLGILAIHTTIVLKAMCALLFGLIQELMEKVLVLMASFNMQIQTIFNELEMLISSLNTTLLEK